jgi:capsular exopolysaccharide synthesis family protein
LFSKDEKSDKGKVVLITSSILGEGKSFIASNLALAAGSYKHKVLLIGADLRRPRLSEYVFVDITNNTKGGLSYLSGYENNWEDLLVQNSSLTNQVDFLFSGPIPPNPSTLFSGDRFKQLLEEAKLKYDYIFIDSAPTIYINDTFLLSHLVDQTIYVTRYNYSDKKLLEFLNELIQTQKLFNVSILLNSIEKTNTSTYKYGYGYGYGYNGYSDKRDNSKKTVFFSKIKKIFSL